MQKSTKISDEIIDMLMDCGMFNSFVSEDLQSAARYFSTNDFKQGTVIFKEGEAGIFMCIVVNGKVSVMKNNSEGKPVELATMIRGRALGEMAVLDGERRSATCIAATECTLLILPKSALEKMLQEEPKVGAKVIAALAVSLSKRLRMAAGKLVDQ